MTLYPRDNSAPARLSGVLSAPQPNREPFAAPSLPVEQRSAAGMLQGVQLPKVPPKAARGPSIWDKQHISETLANIGAGFFSGHNFSDGLGAAAQAISGRQRDLRAEQEKRVDYGGPEDRFEITTDAQGNRTVREVPEFAQSAREARNKPQDPTKAAQHRARSLYAITQLPPERRAEAYRNLIANPDALGVDASGLPPEWSDEFGTLGGMMGLEVNQSLNQERSNVLARDLIRHRGVTEAQGAARVAQGGQRVAQGSERLRRAPPSTRKAGRANPNADLGYLQ